MRKAKNTGTHRRPVARRHVLEARETSRSGSCVRMSEEPRGIEIAKRFVSAFSSGQAKMWKSPGFELSQCASMAAILIGWCLSVLSPCRSPMKSCSGASTASRPIAMRSMVRASVDVPAGEQIARADREHDEARGEVGGVEHVREAIGEARIEDDREPVDADRRRRRASRGRPACASSCWRRESRTPTSRCRPRRSPPTAHAASAARGLPPNSRMARKVASRKNAVSTS